MTTFGRIDDHEGFSSHEGFSFNKRKILRDHGRVLAAAALTVTRGEPFPRRPHRHTGTLRGPDVRSL
jgi:hypothetical protein